MTKVKDLTNQRFGKLIVIERVENNKKGNAQWLCKCDCGNKKIVTGINLRRKHVQSCGCLRLEKISGSNCCLYKHGKTNSRLYTTWHNMKERCLNKKNSRYKYYGARGIKICDEWKNDFMNFYNWAISNGYKDNLTIDRINVNGNYEPLNCRWITIKQQCNNRRNNHLITYNGKTQTMMEWAEFYNINYDILRFRLKKGWSIEKALTERSNNELKKTNK